MNRPISFRAWHSTRKVWLHDKSYGGCHILGETIWAFNQWCRVSIDELNDVIVTQFTGLKDSKGVDIFEGDIIRYHTPERDYQIHYDADDHGHRDPLEPRIKTHIRAVSFLNGAFTFDSDKDAAHNGFVWPLTMHNQMFSSREQVIEAFSSRESQWIDGGDDETGDLSYLLREYGLADEAALIAHLNTFEVVGNVFEHGNLIK